MNYRFVIYFISISIILSSSIIFAETTGQINLTSLGGNASAITGVYGYTVDFCNANTSQCFDYKCFVDFDGTSSGSYSGWCNQSAITNCYHNGIAHATGIYYCRTNTTYHLCTSGSWGSQTSCSSGSCTVDSTSTSNPCSVASSSSSSSSGGASSTATTTTLLNTASIKISQNIDDFSIEQEKSIDKSFTVTNDGKFKLSDITPILSGIDSSWYSLSPSKTSSLNSNSSSTFNINFNISSFAEIKEYTVTIDVTTNDTNAKTSASFKMKVLPSQETIEKEIIPRYNLLVLASDDFENVISTLDKAGKNTTELSKILSAIKSRLEEVNASLESKDYFTATNLMDSVQDLMEEFRNELGKSNESSQSNIFFLIGIFAIVLVSSSILYLFWPYRSLKAKKIKTLPSIKTPIDFDLKYGYKKANIFQKISSKLRRKKV